MSQKRTARHILTAVLLSAALFKTQAQDAPPATNAPVTDAAATNTPAADSSADLRARAAAGDPAAQFALGDKLHRGDGVATNDTEAADWLQKSATAGDASAAFELASLYDNGQGVTKDPATANKWYGKAASHGYATAGFILGSRYANGQDVTKDDMEAVKWFRKGAESGDASAQFELAGMLINGRGAAKDEDEALKWYHKAADGGHASAQFMLGDIYADGLHDVTKDPSEAAKWYRKAAEQGDASAAYRLATLFANGLAMPQEGETAVKWFRQAAEAGYASAQYSLAYRYARGDGVGRKLTEAATWYRKAAEQGDASSQFELADLYAKGRGVKQDRVEALKWAMVAQAQGIASAAALRTELQRKMSSSDTAEAERKAQELLTKFKPGATVEHTELSPEDIRAQHEEELQELQADVQKNPNNFPAVLNLTSACLQLQQTNRAVGVLDQVANVPQLDPNALFAVARAYGWCSEVSKQETLLENLAHLKAEQPEIWYELAGVKALVGKQNESIAALESALNLSARRLAQNPQAHDLVAEVRKDGRFDQLRDSAEFQKLMP